MSEAFEQIALELRRQYSLGYTPSNFVTDGKWRRIEVKAPAARVSASGGAPPQGGLRHRPRPPEPL